MGSKGGGGGRVGYDSSNSSGPRNKGPRDAGGPSGAGGRPSGGGTRAALERIGGPEIALEQFAREAGISRADALAEADRLVASGSASYLPLPPVAAGVLRGLGRVVPERDGLPIRGFRLIT